MAINPVPRKNFKAVIVGGSVTGLTLANIFEQTGIDYVLLEAYGDWAPQVGASIGILASGMRVLDQIGVMEAFTEGVPPMDIAAMSAVGGRALFDYYSWDKHCIDMLGVPIVFADRQKLLQSLYGGLKNKDKMFLNKRVVKITTSESGARVQTQDGSTYHGDIVIGADGIKSSVRQEMWRIAAETSPGYFPGSDSMAVIPIEYKCLFGISKPHKSIPAGHSRYVVGKSHSYLLIGGPGGRVYFFLFVKLPEKIWGQDTPRYGSEDVKALVKEYGDEIVSHDGSVFADIVDGYTSIGMTALHEHVFEKWHYDRIITLGDSAHKPNPISGHGGNSAMESAAALVNALLPALDRLKGSSRLSAADIEAVFRETQDVRQKRVQELVEAAKVQQVMNAPESPLGFEKTRFLPYLLSREKLLEHQVAGVAGAVRIQRLPVPFRPHLSPFNDELPAKPLQYGPFPRMVVALIMVALAFYGGYGLVEVGGLPETFLGRPFRSTITSNPLVDMILLAYTRAFAVGLGSPIPEQYLQMLYFFPMLAPMVLIWVVEANRNGNQQSFRATLLQWPSLFALAYQLFAVARIGPIYFLVTLLVGINPIFHRPISRIVDVDMARAVLPATLLGFVVPTALMLTPLRSNPSLWLDLTTFWQISPLLPGPLAATMAHFLRARRRNGTGRAATKGAAKEDDEDKARAAAAAALDMYKCRDLPQLLRAYATMFWLTAALHVGVIAHILASGSGSGFGFSQPLSLARTFFQVPMPWGPKGSAWHAGLAPIETVFVGFKWDLLVFAATLLVWCLWTVLDLRRLGYTTTREACRAALAIPAALVLVGPGAMYAGTWYWREKSIAGVSRMHEGQEKKNR